MTSSSLLLFPEAEDARRLAAEEEALLEAIRISEMAEDERLEYIRRKQEEAEERELAAEIDRYSWEYSNI